MTTVRQLQALKYSREQQQNIILTNVVKMLTARGLLDDSKLNEHIKRTLANVKDDDTCNILLDHPHDKFNHYKIVLLFGQRISTFSKTSPIGEYILKNTDEYKIIIVEEISRRKIFELQKNPFYNDRIEIFMEKELMLNLIEHIYIPKCNLLSIDDSKKVVDEYYSQKKNFPKIFLSDPLSRYYHAQLGQLFRIIHPSETSGFSICYRVVVNDILQQKSK